MNYKLVDQQGRTYVECLADEQQLASEADALDLIGACGEYRTDRLMLHAESLPPSFYQLRTGLAGAVLQKFSTYQIRVAAVLTPELATQGRFGEMVLEANRGSQFHVFYDVELAEKWLLEN